MMRNADDLPSRSEIFNYWKDRFGDIGIFVDWGEPGCWACHFHYGIKYDIKRSDASLSEILSCWNNIPLQRCHIVPRSLGGNDDVSNLFLMCRECHDLSPNTPIQEIFFEWAKSQSSSARENAKMRAALHSFGVETDEEMDVLRLTESSEFKAWMSDKIGLHWPQSNYAPISSRLTTSTIVGLAVYFDRVVRNGLAMRRP